MSTRNTMSTSHTDHPDTIRRRLSDLAARIVWMEQLEADRPAGARASEPLNRARHERSTLTAALVTGQTSDVNT